MPGFRRQPWWLALVQALAGAIVLMVFVVSGVAISGDSMEPALHDGERALVPRYQVWLQRAGVASFERGDIVYFPSPEQPRRAVCPWFCDLLIKRIVGLEGESVAIENGRVLVDGEPLAEEYLAGTWPGSFSLAPQVVPEGHVFVLGDNRRPYGSFDSRVFGPIPVASLEGRAAWVVWPPLRRGADGNWRWNLRRL